ncbi:MAG TPA: Fis family transcriptional regulator [Nitrosomonas sp.]|nr:Fis family transcriptional regulator [Nitrosomonas sp.]
MINAFNEHFRYSPLFIAVIDKGFVCRDINPKWRKYLGLSDTVAIALPVEELFSHENVSSLKNQIRQVIHENSEVFGRTISLKKIDSSIKSTPNGLLSVWRIRQTDDEQKQALLVFTEMADYTQAVNKLNQLQTTHELILNAVGEGIYGVDKHGNTTFVNEAATRILGWRAEDVIGKSLHDIHHHSYPDGSPYPSSECPIYNAFTDGKVHQGDDEFFWRTDGTPVPVEYTSTPIRENGEVKGAVVVYRDITERRKNEQQREAAYLQIKTLKELLERERDYLRDEINITVNFGEIIGESQALKRTLAQIEAVSRTSTSVLILGESGVGKEMVARAIHANSVRAEKPLVKVNCASIPKELFESEFFGHVRGSFTGAHRDRVGRLHLAAGGTLFLDEVGEIPLDLQGKLLRALQEQEFERVGDDKTIKVDVRIVAATNRDLKAEVESGRFRMDLYYRLSIFPIEVPPLRERIQDIGPLAIQFLKNICQEFGREPLSLTRQQLEFLNSYSWPGNIRELKNIIERAVILTTGHRLRLDLAMPGHAQNGKSKPMPPFDQTEKTGFVTDAVFREKEKLNMITVLRRTNWRISGADGAAELLGIKPSTLAYRMKVYGVNKSDYL